MKISFIVCTYSIESIYDTVECINSLVEQDYSLVEQDYIDKELDKEIIVVMDRNDDLYDILVKSLPDQIIIIVNDKPGLSEARNFGIKNAKGEIIVFIDDDAIAAKNFIYHLIKNYEDDKVVGVYGKILPKGRPNCPEELYWIGGFTNKGFPEEKCEVRNGYGCNMSFKKSVFDRVGYFNSSFGRIGKQLQTCEETEFSIKVLSFIPESKIIYDPTIVVYHKIHENRQTLKYMLRRSFYEGKAKAHIDQLYKKNDIKLSTENKYLKFLLLESIPSRIKNVIIGQNIMRNTKDIILLLLVITSVGFGYLFEHMRKGRY